jgi:phospholipase C
MPTDRSQALDHVVVVLFENRSLDNMLGHLYGPADGKTFEGVIGKNLSNPIPEWAEHGADDKVVPYTVATDMDSPNPDSGEEYPHTNTQLYNILSEENRFKMGEDITAPWNAPSPGQTPTMDGFVTDYIRFLTAEMGRQPTYEEYAQIMTGFTPEQVPVLNGLARAFGVFDHWFCEVPSQTFMNRSFWTAATSSGLTVNSPATKWFTSNDAETIFERLEAHGRTWKVYVCEPMQISFTGLIHYPRLKDRLATHFVPFAQFETDAASGGLPDFSLIEPCLNVAHNDYHPALGRALAPGVALPSVDPPSSILGGEAFLARIYDAYRGMRSQTGTNVSNTTLLIGWDEPGGTYDHVPPPLSHRPTRPARPASPDSGSTALATGCRPSSSRPGWPKGPCSTRSTATPP